MMKFCLPSVVLLVVSVPALLWSQAEDGQEAVEPVTSTAQIIGEIRDGTLPEPAPPPLKLQIAPEDVLQSKTVEIGGRQITTQKIVPLELPANPATPSPDPQSIEVRQRIQELAEGSHETKLVLIGATVYKSANLPGARSRIQVWDQESNTSFVCWSSANWNWLAGIGRFKSAEGQQYALILSERTIDIDRSSQLSAQHGKEYVVPVIPELPPEQATFVVTEGTATAAALAPVTALHQIYNSDGDRLQAAFEGRLRAREEREEFLRQNPPQPKNITIRYWRMDEAGQGGVTPKPAVVR